MEAIKEKDRLSLDRIDEIITKILTKYANIPYAHGELKDKLVICPKQDYLLITLGWEGDKRTHDCILHLEIIDRQVVVQYDGIEDGIANELIEAGIPSNQIVLGFMPANKRLQNSIDQ